MATAAPQVFNFGNWDEFYESAMRFHEATRPQERLLNDRIETFRAFMSKNAIQCLGGFLRAHPRFDTTEGWDKWTEGVADALSLQESVPLRRPNGLGDAVVVGDVTSKFKSGKSGVYLFWQELDELVATGRLSAGEQREIFWNALEKEDRIRFTEQCTIFDPASEVWEKGDSNDAKLAEQELSRIAETWLVDEVIRRGIVFTRSLMCAVLVVTISLIYFTTRLLGTVVHASGLQLFLFGAWISLHVWSIGSVSSVTLKIWKVVRKLRQRKIRMLASRAC